VTRIKFCGLTRTEDAEAAARLGADYVGVIFAGGPRELTPPRAAEVWAAAGGTAKRVGVFGTDFRSRIPAVSSAAPFHVAQLHGDPTVADIAAARTIFTGAVWAVVRVSGTTLSPQVAELLASADAVLFDPRVEGKLGGTGRTLDWVTFGQAIRHSHGAEPRVVLAGGLTPENVAMAIDAVRPAIVDVSSGVESAPGVKDHARMSAFAEAVRRSDR
jgi:phosphoribosylanthranilate isomerase